MKILCIFDYYPPNVGGGEKIYQRIAEYLATKGHDVTVLTQRVPNTNSNEKQGNNLTIIRLRSPLGRLGFGVTSMPRALKLARGSDLIFTSTFSSAFSARFAATLARKPSVILIHEVFGGLWTYFSDSYLLGKCYQLAEKWVTKLKFDKIVVPSLYSYNSMRVYAGKKDAVLELIYHGVENDFAIKPKKINLKTLGLAEDRFICTFFGRAGISKGISHLIKAITDNCERLSGEKFQFALVLSGRVDKKYLEEIGRINSTHDDLCVIIPSLPRDQLISLLHESGCIVIPSLAEGFGFAAVEAGMTGRPVVVSRVAAIPEVISGRVIFTKPGEPSDIYRGLIDAKNGSFQDIPRKEDLPWARSLESYEKLFKSLADED